MAICKEGTYVYEKRKLYVHIVKIVLTICTYSDMVYTCQGNIIHRQLKNIYKKLN